MSSPLGFPFGQTKVWSEYLHSCIHVYLHYAKPLVRDILISSLLKNFESFSDYLSLKTFEARNCENVENTLKINDFCPALME